VTTQPPNELHRPLAPPASSTPQKIPRVEVYWHAVTYRTVAMYAIVLGVILFAALYLVVPGWYSVAYKKVSNAVGANDTEGAPLTPTQAKFVNLDGKVQVKKVNSVQWVDADYHTSLD
jgi:hypothetical protein